MEQEQRVDEGRVGIGKGTVAWVFGEDMDTSDVTEKQFRDLGELIEDIGLRRIKKGLEAGAN